MKKLLKVLLFINLLVLNICMMFNINASQTSEHITNIIKNEEEQLNPSVLYQYHNMDTSFDAEGYKTTRDVYSYEINQTNSTFLATWTYASKDGYSLKKLTDIAKDYEKHHPGWIVLGGVNAEGYYEGEPTNAIVQDSNVIRKDVSAEVFKELIGFKKDGSIVIKQKPIASDYLRLKVDSSVYDITKINELPQDNEVALLSVALTKQLDLTGYNVVEGNYSMYRASNKFPGGTLSGSNLGIFIKGSIVDKVEISSIDEVPSGKFYIVTNNDSVIEQLTPNKDIICEYDYIDEFSDVHSMTGYMYKYLEDGVTIPRTHKEVNDNGDVVEYGGSYYTSISKERCGIGFKEDGTIVLMTVNTDKGGPTQYEVGEIFKEFGCIDAYQFDGGGSVSFVKRTDTGGFEMLNTPGDGSPRSIMTGLLVVTKDPGFTSVKKDSTSTSVTLYKKTDLVFDDMTNISVEIDGKVVELSDTDTKVTINGLEPGKEYVATIKYTQGGVEYTTTLKCETKEYNPGITIVSDTYGFIIKRYSMDPILKTVGVTFTLDDAYTYKMGDVDTFMISDLFKDTTYNISYVCDVLNQETNEIFQIAVDGKDFQTLPYSKPYIEKFEENRKTEDSLRIRYAYEDEDGLVTKAYICLNNMKFELTEDSGTYTFNNMLFNKNTYIIQIELEYELDYVPYYIYSDTLIYEKPACTHEYDNDCDETCNLCGETREITHNYSEATCKAPATCTICGATTGEKPPHTEVIDKAVEATCSKTGLTEGSHCSVCGEVIVAQTETPLLDHTVVVDEAVEATCKEHGLTEGSHCSVCNKVIVEQEKTDKLEHTYDNACDEECNECGEKREVEHDWIDATKKEPKTCSICGKTEGEPLKGCKKSSVLAMILSINLLVGSLLLIRKRK